MWKLSFAKYEGNGNDFILIDDREGSFPLHSRLIQKLCHRKFGIGADGLILIQKGHDFRMRIFNCDGSEPESCGNGLRCFVYFLKELGIKRQALSIEIGPRTVVAEWRADQLAIDMGEVTQVALQLETELGLVHFAHSGVPHAIQFVPNVSVIDVPHLGSLLRHHPLFFPNGANVSFAQLQQDGSLSVRTYERGVEAETLACGTAAIAVGWVAQALYGLKGKIPVHFSGGSLEVEGRWMFGRAQKVFSGEIRTGLR